MTRDAFNTNAFGPQYTVEPTILIDENDGRKYVECIHEFDYSDEGLTCIKCGRYYPREVEDIKVYTYLDKAGYSEDEDGLPDNNYLDWYADTRTNPELEYLGGNHKNTDPEFYDTYDGLLEEIKDEFWTENVKSSYIEDVNTDDDIEVMDRTGEEDLSEVTQISENEFSKESTELDPKLLGFWGHPSSLIGTSKKELRPAGRSVVWTAIRYSRKTAIDNVLKMKDMLDENELEWLREILGDKEITMSRDTLNKLPCKNTKLTWRNGWHFDNSFIESWNNHYMGEIKEALGEDCVLNVKLSKSFKYPGQYFMIVDALLNNKRLTIKKTNKSSNWLPSQATHEELNAIIPMLKEYWLKNDLGSVAKNIR